MKSTSRTPREAAEAWPRLLLFLWDENFGYGDEDQLQPQPPPPQPHMPEPDPPESAEELPLDFVEALNTDNCSVLRLLEHLGQATACPLERTIFS